MEAESSEIVIRRESLQRALSFLACFHQVPQNHPYIAALTAALAPPPHLQGEPGPVPIARHSLELENPSAPRDHVHLLIGRTSTRELLRLQRAVRREMRRRAMPPGFKLDELDQRGPLPISDPYGEPEYLEDLRDLQRVLRDLRPPSACTVAELLEWCRGDLARREQAVARRELELNRNDTLGRLQRESAERERLTRGQAATEARCPRCAQWFPVLWQHQPEPGGLWWARGGAGCPGCGATVLVETECDLRPDPSGGTRSLAVGAPERSHG